MKIQLSEIMQASISKLEDLDLELSFEIESVQRQLSSNYNKGDWRKKAMQAREHMQRAQALFVLVWISFITVKTVCCTALFWLKSKRP